MKKKMTVKEYENQLADKFVSLSTNIEQREGFTGGEWVRRDLEIIGPYGSNKHICEITGNFMDESEALANAALIAQSKKLFFELKDILQWVKVKDGRAEWKTSEEKINELKALLLKANPKQ